MQVRQLRLVRLEGGGTAQKLKEIFGLTPVLRVLRVGVAGELFEPGVRT